MLGSGGTVTYNDVNQTETFTVTEGETVLIRANTSDSVIDSYRSKIFLNGEMVAQSNQRVNHAAYTLTVDKDYTITRARTIVGTSIYGDLYYETITITDT